MSAAMPSLEQLSEMSAEELAQFAEGAEAPAEQGQPAEAKPDETKAADEQGVTSATPGADATQDQTNDTPTAIANKSGNGTIPYTVLAGTRDQLKQAQQTVADLESQKAALEEQLKAGSAAVDHADLSAAEQQVKDLRAQAEDLKEDAPTLAETLLKQADILDKVRGTAAAALAQAEQAKKAQETVQQRSVEDIVQAAIDATPDLADWQASNPEAFDLASQQDAILKNLPRWKDKPLEERFAEAVRLTKVMNPELGAVEPKAKTDETTAAATAAAKPADEKKPDEQKPPIHSLSDMPGGAVTPQSEREKIAERSVVSIGNEMLKDPGKIDDMIAALQ